MLSVNENTVFQSRRNEYIQSRPNKLGPSFPATMKSKGSS